MPEVNGELAEFLNSLDAAAAQTPVAAPPKEDASATPVSREEIEALKEQVKQANERAENIATQSMSILEQIRQAAMNQPQPQPTNPIQTQTSDEGQLWRAAVQVPEAIPDLLSKQIQATLATEMAKVKSELQADNNRDKSVDALRSNLLSKYGADISDAKSPIMQATPQQREVVAHLIDPKLRNTPAHDLLALAVAAAANPEAITDRYSAIRQAEAVKRENQIKNLSKIAGISGGKGGDKEPEINDEDEEMIAKLPGDPKKVREEYLKAKKTERMMGLNSFGSVGAE